MARKVNMDRLKEAERLLRQQPGNIPAHYARQMGCPRETFNRILAQLAAQGVLLWEDEQGRLWLYEDSHQK